MGPGYGFTRTAPLVAVSHVDAVRIEREPFTELVRELPGFREAVGAILRARMATI